MGRTLLAVLPAHGATGVGLPPTRNYQLAGVGSDKGTGTDRIICRESYFQSSTIFSNDTGLCSSQSDLRGLVGDND